MGESQINAQAGGTVDFTWMHAHPPCDATTNHSNVLIALQVSAQDPVTGEYEAASAYYTGAETGIGKDASYQIAPGK